MSCRVTSLPAPSPAGSPARDRERGSATIWVLALMALVWFTAAAVLLDGQVRAARQQASTAADLAALAAAERALQGPDAACRAAAEIADANGARLRRCGVEGSIADVTAAVRLPAPAAPLTSADRATARARAGPAGAGPGQRH